jgi:hypothetical protein
VNKTSLHEREEYLHRNYPNLTETMRAVVASSEDAFDAAVSALVMWEHATDFEQLERSTDEDVLFEGWIWSPSTQGIEKLTPASTARRAPRSAPVAIPGDLMGLARELLLNVGADRFRALMKEMIRRESD